MTKYSDGYRGGSEKYDYSLKSISRGVILLLLPIIAYTIAIFPVIYSIIYIIQILELTNIFHILLFAFFLVIEFFFLIVLLTFVPGLFIKFLRLKVDEGVHQISIKDWNFFKYILFFVLYRPSLKVIGVLPLLPLRIRYLKLVGLKMGKSSLLAGSELIHDPYMVEIGEQTLIGGWTQITGHVSEEKLIVKKVRIGNNCLIGGKSMIMSGVTIEDNVTLGLNSVVLKNKVLKKGKFYAGIPAKEVINKQSTENL
jgi:acetyltransferase-like isoleucine patch superfamily enzyme